MLARLFLWLWVSAKCGHNARASGTLQHIHHDGDVIMVTPPREQSTVDLVMSIRVHLHLSVPKLVWYITNCFTAFWGGAPPLNTVNTLVIYLISV